MEVSHVLETRKRLQAGRTELSRQKQEIQRDVRRIDAALKALGAKPRGRPPKSA